MIRETISRKQTPAVTSDHWHVVHASWTGNTSEPRFVRAIVSEHDDREAAVNAARGLVSTLSAEMRTRPLASRDQIFVRRPDYRSLRDAERIARRPK